jgi:hypothetical protein
MRRLFNGMTGFSVGLTAVAACAVFGLIAVFRSHQTPDPEVPRRTPLKRRTTTAPKRFYYMKSDRACTERRAPILVDAYINETIADDDLVMIKAHVKQCLTCATRIANAKTIRAASEHYSVPVNATPYDDTESIEQLHLIVIDVTGDSLLAKYRRLAKCRETAGGSTIK